MHSKVALLPCEEVLWNLTGIVGGHQGLIQVQDHLQGTLQAQSDNVRNRDMEVCCQKIGKGFILGPTHSQGLPHGVRAVKNTLYIL